MIQYTVSTEPQFCCVEQGSSLCYPFVVANILFVVGGGGGKGVHLESLNTVRNVPKTII